MRNFDMLSELRGMVADGERGDGGIQGKDNASGGGRSHGR